MYQLALDQLKTAEEIISYKLILLMGHFILDLQLKF